MCLVQDVFHLKKIVKKKFWKDTKQTFRKKFGERESGWRMKRDHLFFVLY